MKTIIVPLRGICFNVEPSLQWVFDVFNFSINTGDDDPSTSEINSNPQKETAILLGDEIRAQYFTSGGQVTLTPLCSFGPTTDPVTLVGWYQAGRIDTKSFIWEIREAQGKLISPSVSQGLVFTPGNEAFAIYSMWPYYNNRTIYQEDYLNNVPGTVRASNLC